MSPIATRYPSRPLPIAARPLIAVALASCLALVPAALIASECTVRWATSPKWSSSGQPLPPAASYEVWVSAGSTAEVLAATVQDTSWVLPVQPATTYLVRVRGVSAQGLKSPFSPYSEPWREEVAATVQPAGSPDCGPARPNPFNATTAIAYLVPDDLSAAAPLALDIFDVRGRRLRSLALDRSPGAHEAAWDGRDGTGRTLPAGVYLAQYVCGRYRATVRLTLVS